MKNGGEFAESLARREKGLAAFHPSLYSELKFHRDRICLSFFRYQ